MSFWQDQTGKKLTGSAEDSFNSGFQPIPNGTMAVAMIRSFELVESPEYEPRYQVRWKIMEGEFKNREIFQNIYAFDKDADRTFKAKNMMMRIYKLCQHQPTHSNAPTNQDLLSMQNSICTIKIGMYIGKDGKKRNSLDEVHESTFVPLIEDSALTKYKNHTGETISDDMPF